MRIDKQALNDLLVIHANFREKLTRLVESQTIDLLPRVDHLVKETFESMNSIEVLVKDRKEDSKQYLENLSPLDPRD